jgi:glycosyltransferase involved in cell wall biosynthesis
MHAERFAMHIVNIMFSRDGGGIEQAFVDYCEGLERRGNKVTAIIYPGAVVEKALQALGVSIITMRNLGEWDPIATHRLRSHLQAIKPDAVIAHANRAYGLAERAVRGMMPLIAVAQNYSTRRFTKADAVYTTTHDLIAHLVKQGVPENRVHHIPNMVKCRELPHRNPRHDPPIIGTMGRFVAKKGFDIFIDALSILKERNYEFKAILGGNGEEGEKLKQKSRDLGLNGILSFPGWIEDKKEFYTHIDIFCLPSLHEPFGIVLLEAFTYGAPVVATDSEGPRDIITPNYDALIAKMGSASDMAEAIARLLDNPRTADDLAANAFAKAKMRYSLEVVCEKIEQSCKDIIGHWSPG